MYPQSCIIQKVEWSDRDKKKEPIALNKDFNLKPIVLFSTSNPVVVNLCFNHNSMNREITMTHF